MSKINQLLIKRNELNSEIRNIEQTCEGIENEHNAQKISELNLRQAKLSAEKISIGKKLSQLENELNKISDDIRSLSGTGISKILDAIKNQRWYYFKNKPKVIMDRDTALLWVNPNYFKYRKEDGYYTVEEARELENFLSIDGYTSWQIPNKIQFDILVEDKSVPFYTGPNKKILGHDSVILNINNQLNYIWTDRDYPRAKGGSAVLILSSREITYEDYKNNISPNNKVYTEIEQLQFTLNIFINNGLEPIFDDDEITQLYKKIYFEKPSLIKKLNTIQEEIDSLQEVSLLSSTFDYNTILINYDINSIDSSIIKYYEAIQSWIDDLISKLQYFEDAKWDIIKEFNVCGLKLSRKYEDNVKLNEEENLLLKNRQVFLRKNIDLGMSSVKTKLLSVKNQADVLESRIEEINDSENSITLLAELEEEKRASFKFIAENTANIIKNALVKVEYFEANKDFVTNIINSESKWSENYKVFKTKDNEELKSLSEEDGIEEEVYMSWYQDWRNKKYILESSFTELIKQGIKKSIVSVVKDNNESKYMIEEVINILETYSENIDTFYKNERKNIHQKYAFVLGGEIQEKLEAESELYKITSKFQSDLQNIIFKLDSVEERIFLLKWAEEIIDLQVNEVLYFVKDKDFNKISETILNQFADLKRNNIENYISDAQLYSEEKSNREKQFNSLMYKMRKELMA